MPPIPDRRAMERVMAGLVGGLGGRREERGTPKDEAQELIYAAWETRGEERIELALKAIETDPNCGDAYVILAEATSDLEEARNLYDQGMAAAERTLGERAFKEDVGHFWSILETLPYMRARAGLAQCLWGLGEKDAAIEHFRKMLRLNPGDNQGTRYVLLSCLQDLGRDEEAQRLLEEHKDEITAAWAYSWALADFRREGDSPGASKHLREAIERNPHVPVICSAGSGSRVNHHRTSASATTRRQSPRPWTTSRCGRKRTERWSGCALSRSIPGQQEGGAEAARGGIPACARVLDWESCFSSI